ncbi:methyltransferase domain-containing protein [Plectosphaerella cucumerina]|uniref:Methyltransferase domain-containing protein n=1 Tax=Plectosphaerella cucumerina TaxID=40658 RepID=A0A8K0TFW0_9PEZI|nr:methyltransferase domain-containing protein [Plectosphaerella cucumerina]
MIPKKPLPYSDEFSSAEEYVDALLDFTHNDDRFQMLAGGVHLLDFFTGERSLFEMSLPEDWQKYILARDSMSFVNALLRDDHDSLPEDERPPPSLAEYIRNVRRLYLRREYAPQRKVPQLSREVAVGMKTKKVHEVSNFADYVDRLADDISTQYGKDITHLVDFGSGQNYLGRTLALPPYNKHVIAVEGREHNIAASRDLDVKVGLATREKVHRNKKVWMQVVDSQAPEGAPAPRAKYRAAKGVEVEVAPDVDLRPTKELGADYIREPGKGTVSYVMSRLENGDLTDVIAKIEDEVLPDDAEKKDLRMMAVSIHSCGNLSHYGIRSLVMNEDIHAVAIVGCCYNLLTEKLGPPTYKFPYVRPSLQAANGRVFNESHKFDPEGFPISERMCRFRGDGVRFNITARMMACQAPYNWGVEESHHFFTRNLYRSVFQRMLLDRGVIRRVFHRKGDENGDDGDEEAEDPAMTPFDSSTNPVILGNLRKNAYDSFASYVRGAITKLSTHREWNRYSAIVKAKMSDVTDEEIARYEREFLSRGREVSAIWTLMAFSGTLVESLIVTDRWLFLKEHTDVVRDCWVETVFDYKESPRNLVVIGIKK